MTAEKPAPHWFFDGFGLLDPARAGAPVATITYEDAPALNRLSRHDLVTATGS
jgi:hypothetical protein